MSLMVKAGIGAVFVGVESPNEASLRETKKLQNVHQASTLADRVHAIQESGMEVYCGMILGFDHDDPSIFDAHHRFLDEARVANAMVGMLTAVPKTPLYSRLAREGRLDLTDMPEHGTNVIPLQMTREQLRQGYTKLMGDLYAPHAFFKRLDSLYIGQCIGIGRAQSEHWRRQPWLGLRTSAMFLAAAATLYVKLIWGVDDALLRHEYRWRIWRLLKVRREPIVIYAYVVACALHYHFYTLTRELTGSRGQVVNSF